MVLGIFGSRRMRSRWLIIIPIPALKPLMPELLVEWRRFVYAKAVPCDGGGMRRWVRVVKDVGHFIYLAFWFICWPLAFGKIILGDSVSADTYVINLPLRFWPTLLAVIALLPHFAATGMVTVAGWLLCGWWVTNASARWCCARAISEKNFSQFAQLLLNARRLAIVIILGLGYGSAIWPSWADSDSFIPSRHVVLSGFCFS